MFIDIIFVVLVIIAAIKGYQQGLIVGLFSFIAIIIGLAAAMKLSTVVAGYLGESVNVSYEWLPLVSFALVFLLVVLLVRWGANAIQRTVEMVMLGWVNRLGGVVFYVAIYVTVFSVLLFYAEQVKLVSPAAIDNSLTYSFAQPWGPKAINGFGSVVPVFQDMFAQLEDFFSDVSQEISRR